MRTLHLTLKKRWFDMIASGEKKEEYREIKDYWIARLMVHNQPQKYQCVQFRNGYSKDAPTMLIECKGISIGKPAFKWYGAETNKNVFIISLGNIIAITTKS